MLGSTAGDSVVARVADPVDRRGWISPDRPEDVIE